MASSGPGFQISGAACTVLEQLVERGMRIGVGGEKSHSILKSQLPSRMQMSTECSCDAPAVSHPTCSPLKDSMPKSRAFLLSV